MKINYKKLIISLALPQLAGLLGSLFTTSKIPGWYQALVKPDFNPPSWVFGPVWTILFIFMGIAFYLVWIKFPRKSRDMALKVFIIQLILNSLWSILFFGLQSPGLALFEIMILWIAIFWTIYLFYKQNKLAGILLTPYILWVSFASILNLYIFILN